MTILEAIAAERIALQGFINLLKHEQTLLIENQTSELLTLAQQKTQSAQMINQLSDARNVLLTQAINKPLDASIVQQWIDQQAPEYQNEWALFIRLAREAHQINQTNGELIQMHLRNNQQTLNALNRAANKSNLYGPNGQQSFATVGKRTIVKV